MASVKYGSQPVGNGMLRASDVSVSAPKCRCSESMVRSTWTLTRRPWNTVAPAQARGSSRRGTVWWRR